MKKELEKICLFCEHFYFDSGSQGYSEYTPGSEMSIGCWKDHWEIEFAEDDTDDYRRKMLSAETCKDFKLRKEVT